MNKSLRHFARELGEYTVVIGLYTHEIFIHTITQLQVTHVVHVCFQCNFLHKEPNISLFDDENKHTSVPNVLDARISKGLHLVCRPVSKAPSLYLIGV